MTMQTITSRLNDFLFPCHQCPTFRLSALPPKPESSWTIPPLPDEIWLEIFEFATYLHPAKTMVPLDAFSPTRISNNAMAANTPYLTRRAKCALVLVCRSWRRIALRYLYEHISISSSRRANLVLDALRRSCEPEPQPLIGKSLRSGFNYGLWTRHLEIFARERGDLAYLITTFEIMKLCPNLNYLTGHWGGVSLPKEYLEAIPKVYGSSLKGLHWDYGQHLLPDAVPFFASFTSLLVLDLRDVRGEEGDFKTASLPARPCLPRLNTLVLSSRPFSPFFASLFAFPSLENVTVEPCSYGWHSSSENLTKMLAVHGKNIVSIDILSPVALYGEQDDRFCGFIDPYLFLRPGVCPNLRSLTFPQASPPASLHSHSNLRRIGLRSVKADHLYPNKSSPARDHLMAINRDLYPNLEVVRTVGFLVDSCGDSLIKDIFIWWTERFEAQGVDFQDGEGVVWLYSESEPALPPGDHLASPSSTENSVSQT